MEVPMFRTSHVVIPRSTTHLAKRLAQPFFRRKLFHARRALWPALAALTFASVAHAQGTMDFSGAQTLMGTFNMGSPTIQAQVVFPHRIQVISKQPVRTFDRQREHVRELKQHTQCGMVARTTQVRE
jgi:hypothetical protein